MLLSRKGISKNELYELLSRVGVRANRPVYARSRARYRALENTVILCILIVTRRNRALTNSTHMRANASKRGNRNVGMRNLSHACK